MLKVAPSVGCRASAHDLHKDLQMQGFIRCLGFPSDAGRCMTPVIVARRGEAKLKAPTGIRTRDLLLRDSCSFLTELWASYGKQDRS